MFTLKIGVLGALVSGFLLITAVTWCLIFWGRGLIDAWFYFQLLRRGWALKRLVRAARERELTGQK